MQTMDDVVRLRNGPEASTRSGTVDQCGRLAAPPEQAPAHEQWVRETEPLEEDFTDGIDPDRIVIGSGYNKGCCDPKNISRNVRVAHDIVHGVRKPVVVLAAQNRDVPTCGTGGACYKYVTGAGMLTTAGLFASGRYEVVARFPRVEGLAAALWTFHYEQHYGACAESTCYCGPGGRTGCPHGKCMPPSRYGLDGCPMHGAGEPCANTTLCDQWWEGSVAARCVQSPKEGPGPDPQFLESASFSGYTTQLNHEIDIEIPAGCTVPGGTVCTGAGNSCAGMFNTANLNNYLYTNNGGIGPAYANMCVKLTEGEAPVDMLDDTYHNYTIVWHTGSRGQPGNTSFYFDGTYMGTNNAFVPTRASRFNIAFWPAGWTGRPDAWGGGHAGDGREHEVLAYVSSVRITPFNEPSDLTAIGVTDQPDGCTPGEGVPGCHDGWTRHRIPVPAAGRL